MSFFITVGFALSLLGGTTQSYAAICDCGAPPSCGPSRPPHCPLEMKTLELPTRINCSSDITDQNLIINIHSYDENNSGPGELAIGFNSKIHQGEWRAEAGANNSRLSGMVHFNFEGDNFKIYLLLNSSLSIVYGEGVIDGEPAELTCGMI